MKQITLVEAVRLFEKCRHCHLVITKNNQVALRDHLWTDLDITTGQVNQPRKLIAATLRCPGCNKHLCTMLIEP